MKEVGRRCQRCQYGWYATPVGASPGKPRWFDEAGSFWTDGQARMSRRVSNFERHQQQKTRFDECPNCGSKTVKTDRSRGFQPTGAITPTAQVPAAAVPPSAPSASLPPQEAGAGPSTPPSPSLWQQIGRFHARHWRMIWTVIFAVAPLGSFGDETVYTGGTVGNVLRFVGILVACWAVAAVFLTLHLKHRAGSGPGG